MQTETELITHLNVARNTVREAIKVLVYLGLLEIRRPNGTYVSNGFSDKMLNPLLYSLILEDSDSVDIIELRNILEVSSVSLAIEKATTFDLEKIKEQYELLCELLRIHPNDYDAIVEKDIEFHAKISNATHNTLISRIYAIITQLTIPTRLKTTQKIIETGNIDFLYRTHGEILQIIQNKEIYRVTEVVSKSFMYWTDIVSTGQ